MEVDSDLVTAIAAFDARNVDAFAGVASPSLRRDTFAIRAIAGATGAAFETGDGQSQPNDYVVSVESAFAGTLADKRVQVESDHFSYIDAVEVREAIQAIRL